MIQLDAGKFGKIWKRLDDQPISAKFYVATAIYCGIVEIHKQLGMTEKV